MEASLTIFVSWKEITIMLSRYALINFKNSFSSKLETNHALYEAELFNAMQVIMPWETTEKQLGNEVAVLRLQIEILEDHLRAPTTQTIIELNQNYQKKLGEIAQQLIESYNDFLKARDYYFKDNQHILLDDHKRQGLLHEFQQHLQHEMLTYASFRYEDSNSLDTILASLKTLREEKEEHAWQLLQQKGIVGNKIESRRIEYGKKELDLKQTYEKKVQAITSTLPQLAAKGDLANMKVLVAQQSLFKRRAYINQLDADGFSALHEACGHGHIQVVQYLFEQGADPNQPSGQGYLPLHYAVEQNHPHLTAIVDQLIRAGSKVTAVGPYNITPLHTAAFYGNDNGVQLLLSRGAVINAQESKEGFGITPLHSAAAQGHSTTVALLLKAGANPFARNKMDELPLYEALRVGYMQTAQVFLDAGYWLPKPEVERLKSEVQKSGHADILHLTAQLLTKQAIQLSISQLSNNSIDPTTESSHHATFSYRQNTYSSLTHFQSASNNNETEQDYDLQKAMHASLEQARKDEVKVEHKIV
jgi:ankyrin repeat protein